MTEQQTRMAVIQQMADELAHNKARIGELTRELGMLRKAQPHLRGIPARHNLIRIAEREDLLKTLTYLLTMYEPEDVEYEVRESLAHAAKEAA